MVTQNIAIPLDEITDFCRRHRVHRLALFGSVLREDFRPDSDIDVLVDFELGARPTLTEYIEMEEELAAMFERKVDLVERRLVEKSENYLRRNHILKTARVIYER